MDEVIISGGTNREKVILKTVLQLMKRPDIQMIIAESMKDYIESNDPTKWPPDKDFIEKFTCGFTYGFAVSLGFIEDGSISMGSMRKKR